MMQKEAFISAQPIQKSEFKTIKGRDWVLYQLYLGIESSELRNKRVLNFGSGYSDIGKTLSDKGLDCNIVDIDLRFKPQNTEDRNFINGDGIALPFSDKTFDYVLALWSTYQIPLTNRKTVYKELMRVGKKLHFGPIFKKDFYILDELVKEKGYEILTCQPFSRFELSEFTFSFEEYYSNYVDQNCRIKMPEKDEPVIKSRIAKEYVWDNEKYVIKKSQYKYVSEEGGSTIVMKRKSL